MRILAFAIAAILGTAVAAPPPALAQAVGADVTATKPSRARKATKREPTAGQMAARERQRKCGIEWKDVKAKGATGGQKWPQFYSKCNARLKGGSA